MATPEEIAFAPESPIEHDALNLGPLIGSPGAKGTVRQVGPEAYYKEYFAPPADAARLARLIAWREELTATRRRFLDAHCAWPRRLVLRDGSTAGFLMSPAPAAFWADMAGERHTLELQHLIHRASAERLGIAVPDQDQRLALVRDLAELLAFFDSHAMVYGDLNERNVLWSVDPAPRIYLVDCDNARPSGDATAQVAVARGATWRDPSLRDGELPTIDSDRYGLAVFVYRVLYGVTAAVDGRAEQLLLPADGPRFPALEGLLGRAFGRGPRPSAGEWLAALDTETSSAAGRSRRRPWRYAVGTAAAAVVLVSAGAAVAAHHGRQGAAVAGPPVPDSSAATVSLSSSPSVPPPVVTKSSGRISAPGSHTKVQQCAYLSGSARLAAGKTLLLAMKNLDNGDATQYVQFVFGWKDPSALSSWRGAQYFGTGNDSVGQHYRVTLMAVDLATAESADATRTDSAVNGLFTKATTLASVSLTRVAGGPANECPGP